MDSNSYQSPAETPQRGAKRRPAGWHPLTFAILGFALGTAVASPFILSLDPVVRFYGGALYGGTLGAIAGLAHGLERRRKVRETLHEDDIKSE
jgi:hypothetical protein